MVVSFKIPHGAAWWDSNKKLDNFDPDKTIKDSPIGTEINLQVKGMEGTFYANENIIKVGADQYVGQGVSPGGVLSMKQVKEGLIKAAQNANRTIEEGDIQVRQIKVSSATVNEK
jgi:hypothetical protein